MANEIEVKKDTQVSTGNTDLSTELARRYRDLQKSDYYTRTQTPGQYLKSQKRERADAELELTPERESPNTKEEDKIVPLPHWNKHIQKVFESLDEKVQKAWVDSFKIVEKSYVKQLNEIKSDLDIAAPLLDIVLPYREGIEKIGLSVEEYIKKLIEFDLNLAENPGREIAKLIHRHDIKYDDLYGYLQEEVALAPQRMLVEQELAPIKKELEEYKKMKSSQLENEYVNKQADDIISKITAFYEQTDKQGNMLYPNAFDQMQDIIELIQMGETLDDAYNFVMKEKNAPQSNQNIDMSDSPINRNTVLSSDQIDKQSYLNKLKQLGY